MGNSSCCSRQNQNQPQCCQPLPPQPPPQVIQVPVKVIPGKMLKSCVDNIT